MNTVTAKEFQNSKSKVLNQVARGARYRITYHGKPWVELRPISPETFQERTVPGSVEAFRQSLAVEFGDNSSPEDLDYKELRKRVIRQKYGF